MTSKRIFDDVDIRRSSTEETTYHIGGEVRLSLGLFSRSDQTDSRNSFQLTKCGFRASRDYLLATCASCRCNMQQASWTPKKISQRTSLLQCLNSMGLTNAWCSAGDISVIRRDNSSVNRDAEILPDSASSP